MGFLSIFQENQTIQNLLSIPFMGFSLNFFISSSNVYFQFPLWDSKESMSSNPFCSNLSIPFMGFAKKIATQLNLTFFFQFPLWDSLPICNSILGMLKELSIPFMGFFSILLFSPQPAFLSIPFMGFM